LQAKPDSSSNGTAIQSSCGTVIFEPPSRTRSQRKTLRKFTREIELYLQACRSLPKRTLIATPSLSTISARTIDELKPYQAQFQSAGLAVTSDQQRRLSKPQVAQLLSHPPKGEKWPEPDLFFDDNMIYRKDKQKEKLREPSYASGSTGTTVLGWTPPHEKEFSKTSPQPELARQPSSESDHTIIGFTPPHEKAPSAPARRPPHQPKSPSKKSLPWLRKPGVSPGSVSPTNKINHSSNSCQGEPPTPLNGWVSTSDYVAKDKETERIRENNPIVPRK
jgi:hypothetical protein